MKLFDANRTLLINKPKLIAVNLWKINSIKLIKRLFFLSDLKQKNDSFYCFIWYILIYKLFSFLFWFKIMKKKKRAIQSRDIQCQCIWSDHSILYLIYFNQNVESKFRNKSEVNQISTNFYNVSLTVVVGFFASLQCLFFFFSKIDVHNKK